MSNIPATILITDLETTGLVPGTDAVVEAALVLYDVEHACVVESFSSLIKASSNPAAPINRISEEVLRVAPHPDYVWKRIESYVADARRPAVFMAHRAEFDRGFYPSEIAARLPWVCSKFDCEWPQSKVGASLVETALAHDVPVHANHRALTDCMLLASVMTRVRADLPRILERALRPQAIFQALVSYDDREKAKAAGFGWNGADKTWTRRMAREDALVLPFPTRELAS